MKKVKIGLGIGGGIVVLGLAVLLGLHFAGTRTGTKASRQASPFAERITFQGRTYHKAKYLTFAPPLKNLGGDDGQVSFDLTGLTAIHTSKSTTTYQLAGHDPKQMIGQIKMQADQNVKNQKNQAVLSAATQLYLSGKKPDLAESMRLLTPQKVNVGGIYLTGKASSDFLQSVQKILEKPAQTMKIYGGKKDVMPVVFYQNAQQNLLLKANLYDTGAAGYMLSVQGRKGNRATGWDLPDAIGSYVYDNIAPKAEEAS